MPSLVSAGVLACLFGAAQAAPVSVEFTTEYDSQTQSRFFSGSPFGIAEFAIENSTMSARFVFDDALAPLFESAQQGIYQTATGGLFIDGYGQVGGGLEIRVFNDAQIAPGEFADLVSFRSSPALVGPDRSQEAAFSIFQFDVSQFDGVGLDQVIDWSAFTALSELTVSVGITEQDTVIAGLDVLHRFTSAEGQAVPLPAAALLFPAGLAALASRRGRAKAARR